jgi:hypothetical protein
VVSGHLCRAVRADEEQRSRTSRTKKVAEQGERGRPGPVEIVEAHEDGPARREIGQEGVHRLEHPPALGTRIPTGRQWHLREPRNQVGDQPGQLTAPGLYVAREVHG